MTNVAGAHQSGNPPGRFTCLNSDGVSCDAYWQNRDAAGGFASAAFGIVHLQGSILYADFAFSPVTPGPIFTLPVGFRPADTRVFTVLKNGTGPGSLEIDANGRVSVTAFADGDGYSLDGIDFPAAP